MRIARGIEGKGVGMTIATHTDRPCDKVEKPFDMEHGIRIARAISVFAFLAMPLSARSHLVSRLSSPARSKRIAAA